jgi:hypothetical protein
MLTNLFQSASQTLLACGENKRGGKLGFVTTLHTWDQKLNAHFHLLCLVAGGAISKNGSRWTPVKGKYLFNARALSLVFRGKFMDRMQHACQRGDIKLAKDDLNPLKRRLYKKPRIVDVRDPAKNPQYVLVVDD